MPRNIASWCAIGVAAMSMVAMTQDRRAELILLGAKVVTAAPTQRTTTGAIQGHEFGLRLSPLEREQLLAFLRTL